MPACNVSRLFQILIFLSSAIFASSFDVTNVTEFQNALNSSAANGENDTINVWSGTYSVNNALHFSSSENHSLTIIGSGAGTTILDGGNSVRILSISTSEPSAWINIRGMTFRNGNSNDVGGGVIVQTNAASITLENSQFLDNSSAVFGGGASLLNETGIISVSNCSFLRNSAIDDAGGLNVGTTDGSIILANCFFEENTVPGVHPGVPAKDGGGAILYVAGSGQVTMTGNTFNQNSAADGGGGCMVYFLGPGVSLTAENNTFTDNIAQLDGGGCFVRINDSGSVIFNNNTFTGNSTVTAGGAGVMIHLNNGSLTYSGNTHRDNDAGEDGGGFWIWNGNGTLDITGNIFSANEADNNGGGALLSSDLGTANLSRNIFYDNSASNVGGGLSWATTSGSLDLTHNTFYGNQSAEGGGAYFYFDQIGAHTSLENNIFWHDIPQAFSMSGAASAVATYSDIENGTGQPWFGNGCIDMDPLFANPAAGDFHLTWVNFPSQDSTKSPCIDAGNPSSPPDPDSTRADMGALYFNQSTGIEEDPSNRTPWFRMSSRCFGQISLSYCLTRASNVQIKIFNIQGVLVESLFDGYKSPGEYHLVWSPQEGSSGVFFCQFKTDEYEGTKKFVFLR